MNLTFEFNLKDSDIKVIGDLLKAVQKLNKEIVQVRKEMIKHE